MQTKPIFAFEAFRLEEIRDQLNNGEQADMDGVRVKVSRQACEEAAQALEDLIEIMNSESKTDYLFGWAVITNRDLTEGRCSEYIKHICDTEACALRLAKGAGVQGSNARTQRVQLQCIGGTWYGPINLTYSTPHDSQLQLLIDKQRVVEARAKSLGLSDEDIAMLRGATK